jgi:hypothetical protein
VPRVVLDECATKAHRPERRGNGAPEHLDGVMTARAIAWLASPTLRLVAVVCIAVVLAACGQGGDGGDGY